MAADDLRRSARYRGYPELGISAWVHRGLSPSARLLYDLAVLGHPKRRPGRRAGQCAPCPMGRRGHLYHRRHG